MMTAAKILRLTWSLAIHRGVDCGGSTGVVCPECGDGTLEVVQPAETDPDTWVGWCRSCDGWYLCYPLESVLVDLNRLALLEEIQTARGSAGSPAQSA